MHGKVQCFKLKCSNISLFDLCILLDMGKGGVSVIINFHIFLCYVIRQRNIVGQNIFGFCSQQIQFMSSNKTI